MVGKNERMQLSLVNKSVPRSERTSSKSEEAELPHLVLPAFPHALFPRTSTRTVVEKFGRREQGSCYFPSSNLDTSYPSSFCTRPATPFAIRSRELWESQAQPDCPISARKAYHPYSATSNTHPTQKLLHDGASPFARSVQYPSPRMPGQHPTNMKAPTTAHRSMHPHRHPAVRSAHRARRAHRVRHH